MRPFKCVDCGASDAGKTAQALRCLQCQLARPKRIAAVERTRRGDFTPMRVDGSWVCLDCRTPLSGINRRGKKIRAALRCHPCKTERNAARAPIRQAASSAVARAIAAGYLARPTSLLCVDCGASADCYDHRDYTRPLQVEPVCRSCNVMRGPADIWPELVKAKGAPKVPAEHGA